MNKSLATALMGILIAATICAARPNIVLIMADDVSPDMFSCFNDRVPHSVEDGVPP